MALAPRTLWILTQSGIVRTTALTPLNWRGGLESPPIERGGGFNEVMFVLGVRVVTGGNRHWPVEESS